MAGERGRIDGDRDGFPEKDVYVRFADICRCAAIIVIYGVPRARLTVLGEGPVCVPLVAGSTGSEDGYAVGGHLLERGSHGHVVSGHVEAVYVVADPGGLEVIMAGTGHGDRGHGVALCGRQGDRDGLACLGGCLVGHNCSIFRCNARHR